jgi:hypothetical protein
MRNSEPSSPVSQWPVHPVRTVTADAGDSDVNHGELSESPYPCLEQEDQPSGLGLSPSTETSKKSPGLFRSLSKIIKRRKDKPSSSKSPRKSLSLGRNSKPPENPLDTEFDEDDPFAILQRQNDTFKRSSSTSFGMMASSSSIPDITDMRRSAATTTNNKNRSKSNLETTMSRSFSIEDTAVRASSRPLEQAQKKQAGAAKQEEQQQVHDFDGQVVERLDRHSPLLTNTPLRDSNTEMLKTPPAATRTSSGGGLQTLLPPFGKSPAREPSISSMGNDSSSIQGGSTATTSGPAPLLWSSSAAIEKLPFRDSTAAATAAVGAPVRHASTISVGNLSVGNAEAAATIGAPLRQLSDTSIGNVSVGNSYIGNAGTGDGGRVTPLRHTSGSSTTSYNGDLPSQLLPQHHPTNDGSSSMVHRERNGIMTNSSPSPRSHLPTTIVYGNGGTDSSHTTTRSDFYSPQPIAASHNFDLRPTSRPDDVPDNEGLRGLSLEALLSPRFDEVSARAHSSLLGHDLDNELRSGGGAPAHRYRRSVHSFETHHPHHHHERPPSVANPPSRSFSYGDDRQGLNAILSPRAEYISSEYYNGNSYAHNNHYPLSRRRDAPRDMATGREYDREMERGTLPPRRSDHVLSSSSSNNYDRYNGDNMRSSNGYGERHEHHLHETARRDSYRDDGLDDLKSQMGGVRPYRGGGGGGSQVGDGLDDLKSQMGGVRPHRGGGGGSRDGGSGFEPPPRFRTTEIEIAPGVYMPLRGSEETMTAIERGSVTRTNCFSCTSELHCLDDAEYILCPVCRVVGPVDSSFDRREMRVYGVGLGILPDQMRRWAGEIHRDRG